jgi:hypothetical protein
MIREVERSLKKDLLNIPVPTPEATIDVFVTVV